MLIAALALLVVHVCAAAAQGSLPAGDSVYRQGLLPSGALLRGDRTDNVSVEGPRAACINCHRPSGLGASEGRIVVPPIIGKYLFRPHSTNVQDLSLPHVPGYRSTREPYTDASLARAIREGVAPNGRSLNYLMPRYALDDQTMAGLIAYLKALSAAPVPGVSADTLHFATIITPDADKALAHAVLQVLENFFADKNAFIRGGHRPMKATHEIEYRVSRRWQLHVWKLEGPPDTWQAQLHKRLADEPVFAVISGLGGRTWEPVHRFCQVAKLPCLLPNVNLPVVAEGDFYPVYFSRGVLLEADLMADWISEQRAAPDKSRAPRRLIQVYRRGDSGEAAAAALSAAAAVAGLALENRPLPADPGDLAEMATALRGLGKGDLVALWLRPDDLAKLPDVAPTAAGVILSGELAGLERAPLPAAWRDRVRMTYPVDLPERRMVRMNFPLAWFKIKQIPVLDERLQSDTYVACGILAETLTEMLDSFVPEYLIERIEVMLSHRLLNGYYPRLGLAQGQRFASKGGYVVRFGLAAGTSVVAEGEWNSP